jgi:hypothetical protein
MKEDEPGAACSMNEIGNVYKISDRKPEEETTWTTKE